MHLNLDNEKVKKCIEDLQRNLLKDKAIESIDPFFDEVMCKIEIAVTTSTFMAEAAKESSQGEFYRVKFAFERFRKFLTRISPLLDSELVKMDEMQSK